MKENVPKINWSVLLGDLGFLAAKMAIDDPECRKEIAPIRAEKQKLIDELKDQENIILRKYKQKYLDQLYAEKENMEKLIVEFLNQRKEMNIFDGYRSCQMEEVTYLSKDKVKKINDELERM